MFTMTGFTSTDSWPSQITIVDGRRAGILEYRGLPVEEWSDKKGDFLDNLLLCFTAKLPTKGAEGRIFGQFA